MSPVFRLIAASLAALAAAACSLTPAAPIADPIPPPRRPADAKTQLEYGSLPPRPGPRY